jgi:DNA-binding NarL/FixJ family response regulator
MITVFLADDHRIVREGLCLLLESSGDIDVVGEASDGREAVQKVKKTCPDVVLMDIAMPHLNGIDATRQILADCPGTQVVILSMYASKEHIFRALRAGARGYLLKETAGHEVFNAIRSVHAGRRFLGDNIADSVIDGYLTNTAVSEETGTLDLLSPREREVLQLVVEGKSSAQIAEVLTLSPKTIETYRSRLMEKLGINDLPSLVKFAIRHGITSAD